ncbi:hypothetical protein KP509_32G017300 [Ceratopteris richardii]|uniref:Uncharacterized protein n=1 Tax=Ceratopteris richardii TaxID=49495 RepID=A0A8T2QTH6_CERRI|nr:hypothetical protein KP509_32G017300 [Ceratopteris richardii]
MRRKKKGYSRVGGARGNGMRTSKALILLVVAALAPAAFFPIRGSALCSGYPGMQTDIAGKACDEKRSLMNDAWWWETSSSISSSLLYQNHIGYRALQPDNTPCPRQGAGLSYYNPSCFNPSPGPVNPYTRGCSTITRCSRDTS